MKSKLMLLLMTMLLTVFSASAGAVAFSGSCPQDLLLLRSKTSAKTVAATITGQGAIAGRVTDKDSGAGVANILVTATPRDTISCSGSGGSARTDANGNYTISGLPSGVFKVKFAPVSSFGGTSPEYSYQYYSNSIDSALATEVQVTEPATTSGINAALVRGGSISGTVRNGAGEELPFVGVVAAGTKGYLASAVTGLFSQDGTYTITGLPADSYTVSFKSVDIGDSAPMYIAKNYPSPVTVVGTADTPNINAVLDVGGSIIGKLVDPSNNPIAGAFLYALEPGVPLSADANFGTSDLSGNFSIGGLKTGTYEVTINGRTVFDVSNPTAPVQKGYILQVFSATVTAPDVTDAGTKTLQPGGMIKGTVTNISGAPLEGVDVTAYDLSTNAINNTLTDAAGAYTLTGLPTGSYKVRFAGCQGIVAEQWYNLKPSEASADPVAVTAPNATLNINGVLNFASTNSAPVASGQTVTTTAGAAKPITLAASDANGDPLTFAIVTSPAHGTLSGTPPAVTYTPANGYSGPDSFTFKANDGKTDSNVATVTIEVTAKPGDCNGSGIITLSEVQDAVSMFLGVNAVAACIDINNDTTVTSAELQKTINGFLGL